MKGHKYLLVVILMGVVFAVGCKRESTIDQPSKKTKLSQIVYEFGKTEITYHPDGRLKEFTISNNNSVVERTSFRYAGNKLDTVSTNGVVYKYYYTNERLSSVEVYPRPGELVAKFEFIYANGVLAEQVKHVMVGQPKQLTPYSKLKYTFSAAGNLQNTQIYFWFFGGWTGIGDEVTYEYDDKENSITHLEQEPFLPEHSLMKNNPVKEIHKTPLGDTTKTVTYKYTYNGHNQPITRQTKMKARGAAETNSTVTLRYAE